MKRIDYTRNKQHDESQTISNLVAKAENELGKT